MVFTLSNFEGVSDIVLKKYCRLSKGPRGALIVRTIKIVRTCIQNVVLKAIERWTDGSCSQARIIKSKIYCDSKEKYIKCLRVASFD